MSNSALVCYTRKSPNVYNYGRPRVYDITRISPHIFDGNFSIETCGNIFANPSRQASSNYGIGSDGRIALYVDEDYASECSSSYDNDNRAITVEMANDGGKPDYHVADKTIESFINLCVDICKRRGKNKVLWFGDKEKSLSYKPASNEVVFTVHRWFKAKACPGDYLYNRLGKIADEINKRLNESIANNTTYDGLDYAPVFDFGYYYGKYEDLRNVLGNDKKALFNHFINYGMKEGRQAIPDFNVEIYKNNYADLRNAFKDDLPAYYRHYCVWGKNENRIADTDINKSLTSSIINIENPVTKADIDYADVYDYNYYINHYMDLRLAFELDDVATLQHFINYGMNEGRIAKADFNVMNYKNRYADLQNAFGDDLKSYYLHYMQYGKNEGRIAN